MVLLAAAGQISAEHLEFDLKGLSHKGGGGGGSPHGVFDYHGVYIYRVAH